jgi:hypothetical protein
MCAYGVLLCVSNVYVCLLRARDFLRKCTSTHTLTRTRNHTRTFTHTHTHTHIHTHTHTHTHACTHTDTHTCAHTCMRVCAHARAHTHTHTHQTLQGMMRVPRTGLPMGTPHILHPRGGFALAQSLSLRLPPLPPLPDAPFPRLSRPLPTSGGGVPADTAPKPDALSRFFRSFFHRLRCTASTVRCFVLVSACTTRVSTDEIAPIPFMLPWSPFSESLDRDSTEGSAQENNTMQISRRVSFT